MKTDELIVKGTAALYDQWLLGARGYLNEAVKQGAASGHPDTDRARLLASTTLLLSWVAESASDGRPGNIDRLGDLLDGFGIDKGERRQNLADSSFHDLPDDAPSGADVQQFLYQQVRDDLATAVTLLNQISPDMVERLDNPFGHGQVEVDYGDVLVLRGLCHFGIAVLAFQHGLRSRCRY